jgi:hypothetical protein
MKAILGLVVAVVLAVGGYLFWQYRAVQSAISGPARELVSESMNKAGDTWHVSFVTKFDAPLDKVYEAFRHPERAHELAPDNALKSELASENGNVKVIDLVGKLDILPPGFKVQNVRTEYTYFPEQHRITSRTIDFKLADISSEYKFEATPDGKGTILRFGQQSRDKGGMPVESLQKGALRETYLIQVRQVNKALGLATSEKKKEAS